MPVERGRDRAEWIDRVERLNESGLSVGEFAAREKLHPGSLALWRARLRDSGEVVPEADSVAMSFVALSPVERSPSSACAPVSFDVVVDGGRTVRVWPRFDAAELVRLLAVLEGRCA